MVYRIKKVQLGILIAYEEIRSYHNNMQEKMMYLMTKLGVIIMVHKNYGQDMSFSTSIYFQNNVALSQTLFSKVIYTSWKKKKVKGNPFEFS